MHPLQWLARIGNALLAEIPPPKSKQRTLITPEQLSPTERDIIARAEESLQLIETQSQAILERIRETPVIAPAPKPVTFLAVPEVSEIPEILATVEPVQVEEPPAAPLAALEPAPAKASRKQLVESLLDEAWQQGHTTYAALIGYVAEQTGKGCSKRVIAAWKQSRQLDQVAA